MSTSVNTDKIGIFIDVDNLVLSADSSSKPKLAKHQIRTLLDAIAAHLGNGPSVRKAFISPRLRWAARAFAGAGFDIILAEPLTASGKNAADIRMTLACVDAVTLLEVSRLAVVSNDSDFTPLLVWARSRGVETSIVLNGKHADAYAQTADQVIVLDTDKTGEPEDRHTEAIPEKATIAEPKAAAKSQSNKAAYANRHPDFAAVAGRLDRSVRFPWLDPAIYRAAFKATAARLADSAPEIPWDLYRDVRDELRNDGHEFSAQELNELFRRLHVLNALVRGSRAGELAEIVVGYVEGCLAAQGNRLGPDESLTLTRMLGFEGTRPLRLVG